MAYEPEPEPVAQQAAPVMQTAMFEPLPTSQLRRATLDR